MIVSRGLDDAAELAVGNGQAWVSFLDVHLAEFLAEGGFSEAEGYEKGKVSIEARHTVGC